MIKLRYINKAYYHQSFWDIPFTKAKAYIINKRFTKNKITLCIISRKALRNYVGRNCSGFTQQTSSDKHFNICLSNQPFKKSLKYNKQDINVSHWSTFFHELAHTEYYTAGHSLKWRKLMKKFVIRFTKEFTEKA